MDPVQQPLKPPEARQLAREIVENGIVEFSDHAEDEMEQDDLVTADCVNLVRAGVVADPEFINGEWRYQIFTSRICVVITFLSEKRLRVVTAWRFKQ